MKRLARRLREAFWRHLAPWRLHTLRRRHRADFDGVRIGFDFLYDSRLFEPARMDERVRAFLAFLSGIARDPARGVDSLPIPDEAAFLHAVPPQDEPAPLALQPDAASMARVRGAVRPAWLRHLEPATLEAAEGHFFEAGGHSLMAMEIAHALEKSLGVRVPLRLFVEHPTLEALATHLAAGPSMASPGEAAGERAGGRL